jgi:proteasome alpha subunit
VLFAPRGLGYDRAITIFSPDGRLFQVEYAIEAVKRGTAAIGVKTKEGAVLVVEKRSHTKLIELDSIKKIFAVDRHIGVAIAGLTADARTLVNQIRIQAQVDRLTYDEPPTVETLTQKLGDLKQLYTQHAGVRPFGVSLLVAGVDDSGPKLYSTEPSGSIWGHKAAAIGSGAQAVTEYLEEVYSDSMTLDEGLILALRALKQAVEEDLHPQMVEVAIIPEETRILRILAQDELKQQLEKI